MEASAPTKTQAQQERRLESYRKAVERRTSASGDARHRAAGRRIEGQQEAIVQMDCSGFCRDPGPSCPHPATARHTWLVPLNALD
jgi:hypothetical protein